MKCPYCNNADTRVIDSRESEESETIRRRRECMGCNDRFTTYERIEKPELIVIKKDKTRESFDREKVKKGIWSACEKRQVSEKHIEAMLDAIENEARNTNSVEVSSRFVGELVMKYLRHLDEVAYVRFASVYREFKDAKEFMDELKIVVKDKKQKIPKITIQIDEQINAKK